MVIATDFIDKESDETFCFCQHDETAVSSSYFSHLTAGDGVVEDNPNHEDHDDLLWNAPFEPLDFEGVAEDDDDNDSFYYHNNQVMLGEYSALLMLDGHVGILADDNDGNKNTKEDPTPSSTTGEPILPLSLPRSHSSKDDQLALQNLDELPLTRTTLYHPVFDESLVRRPELPPRQQYYYNNKNDGPSHEDDKEDSGFRCRSLLEYRLAQFQAAMRRTDESRFLLYWAAAALREQKQQKQEHYDDSAIVQRHGFRTSHCY